MPHMLGSYFSDRFLNDEAVKSVLTFAALDFKKVPFDQSRLGKEQLSERVRVLGSFPEAWIEKTLVALEQSSEEECSDVCLWGMITSANAVTQKK